MPPVGLGCLASAKRSNRSCPHAWAMGDGRVWVGSQRGGSGIGRLVIGPSFSVVRGFGARVGERSEGRRLARRVSLLAERAIYFPQPVLARPIHAAGDWESPPQAGTGSPDPATDLMLTRPARAGRPTSEANFIDKTGQRRKENTGNFGTFGIFRPGLELIMDTYG
jgi:hypothetical protein